MSPVINAMKRWTRFLMLAALVVLGAASRAPGQSRTLDIYFIDVEGGAATLIVTPAGESLLVDSGWPGERDPARIAAVARAAGLRQIDHYLTTHWHRDHFGGIARLAELIPVRRFYGHRIPDPLPPDINADLLQAYHRVSGGRTIWLRAGDAIRLQSPRRLPPLRLRVLAADGLTVGERAGASQVRPCDQEHPPLPEDPSDNARSIAFLLSFGAFRFFDGGDLTWNVEHKLACPANLIGRADVYQVNHHGLDTSNHPALVAALAPRVAVINNGARKGGQPRTFATLRDTPGIEAIFQLHRNVETAAADNAPPAHVANDAENCNGDYIKLSVAAEGKSYRVMLPGKGVTREFRARR